PLDGPIAVVRVDPAPGFIALKDDSLLKQLLINIEIGRVKNVNKNPVAEKAIQELEEELLRQEPGGGAINQLDLSIAIARLNARIRFSGLSSRELWTQRSQFTHEQLPILDRDIIVAQHKKRSENHSASSMSKHKSGKSVSTPSLNVGDLVYLYTDKDKSRARNRYLVVSVDGEWCHIKKFVGNQLRSTSYKAKVKECYKVPSDFTPATFHSYSSVDTPSDDENDPPEGPSIPLTLSEPATRDTPVEPDIPILIGTNDEHGPDHHETPSQPDNTHISHEMPSSGTLAEPFTQEQARPKRTSKPPRYLEDYVRY
ncbi:MAG: hypothetical protein ABW092_16090, partial [Candidatus Thiodiazotropha sp.]